MIDRIVEFLDEHECKRRIYLGDSVYIGHDGYQIWLVTDRSTPRSPTGGSGLHYIALDPQVQETLRRYLDEQDTFT
jgi:hypothetical protein